MVHLNNVNGHAYAFPTTLTTVMERVCCHCMRCDVCAHGNLPLQADKPGADAAAVQPPDAAAASLRPSAVGRGGS